MLDESKSIYLEDHTRHIRYTSSEEGMFKNGTILADLWLKEKAKYIDLWGSDWFGENFINAFLLRILESQTNLDGVADIQWFYTCETCNHGFPLWFYNYIWINNFLSKDKIVVPAPESVFNIFEINHEDLQGIKNEIHIENNQITNAKYISDKLRNLVNNA